MLAYTVHVPSPPGGWQAEEVDAMAKAILEAAAAMISHHLIDADLPAGVTVSRVPATYHHAHP